MDHLDDDLLDLLALGERPATESEARHLAGCAACSSTLEALQHTVFVATVNPEHVELEAPASHNWAAIHAALGLSPSLAGDPLGGPAPGPAAEGAGPADPAAPGGDILADPGSRPSARRQRGGRQGGGSFPQRGPWLLGAAAGILLGAAGAWTALTILGPGAPPVAAPSPSRPTAVVIAQTALAPLAGHSASGSARVEDLPDGSRQLVISLPEEKLTGFREVWVGSADLSKMVSLGVLGQGTRSFVLPGRLNLADYPVLDISNEPYDGNPAHSAESIARGKFAAQG
ncbi:hypothetical protein FFF93_009290 [Arthrobacter sp. KBS0702]|uniref:anti-sigma factor n=1 Tax=Arthrobacter sp. KBS0702 TaxID=2578107 RepID=UPI00110DB6FC|nr:anti-sigma factor [Arthrobacter sp. KBS0702]QDW29939.1 hypothetical protein FFF93_009290 [Arthrobacter sp. KBS0702]